ncbi:MAG TPA: MBL fold metallo-hydrolase [Polyangiaceae bacterium]|nr:MBL fold metallo-hydrolase [Polyangiaceae bacterium]
MTRQTRVIAKPPKPARHYFYQLFLTASLIAWIITPFIRHPHGITTVDAEYFRPGFASVHIIERGGRAGIVDTGANASVPLVERALAELGLTPHAVDWLFLTHVHLDHAGGTGALVERLPRARVLVHPRGAPHVVDPTRLEAATIAVYGQQAFEHLYGKLLPVAVERVQETPDGERVTLGSSELRIFHTPGHALHHQVLFDPDARAVFSGDTFGVSYRELDRAAGAFVMPTTTPTQFDPAQLRESVRRIVELAPESVYLTHFGRVTGVPRLGAALGEQIDRFVELAREHAHAADRHQRIRVAMRDYVVTRAEAHGIADTLATVESVLGADLELNTQGLVAWLARTEKARR